MCYSDFAFIITLWIYCYYYFQFTDGKLSFRGSSHFIKLLAGKIQDQHSAPEWPGACADRPSILPSPQTSLRLRDDTISRPSSFSVFLPTLLAVKLPCSRTLRVSRSHSWSFSPSHVLFVHSFIQLVITIQSTFWITIKGQALFSSSQIQRWEVGHPWLREQVIREIQSSVLKYRAGVEGLAGRPWKQHAEGVVNKSGQGAAAWNWWPPGCIVKSSCEPDEWKRGYSVRSSFIWVSKSVSAFCILT